MSKHRWISKTVLVSLFILLCGYQALACTIAVASGSATVDGRPLLWKNRDISPLDQMVRYFDDGSCGAYLALVTTNVNETTTSYVGVNDAGFAIMNSIAYDLSTGGSTSHGSLMKRALKECASVADFEALLLASSGDRGHIWSNFGVIDRHGEAAIFETNDWDYRRYDADDEGGFIVRANNSVWGGGDLGSRFYRADQLLTDAAATGQLDHEYVAGVLSRDISDVPAMPCGQWSTVEPALNRHKTRSAVVVHGVLPTEDPRLTTFWACLGEPICGISVPLWSSAGTPPDAVCAPGQQPALCAAIQAKESQCYSSLTQDTTIDTQALVGADGLGGIHRYSLPIENEAFAMTATHLVDWRQYTPTTEEIAGFEASIVSRSYALLVNERAPADGGNVFCLPDPETIGPTDEDPAGSGIFAEEIVVTYAGGGSGPLFGYSIDVSWDTAVLSAIDDDFDRPDTGPFAGAAVFQTLQMGPGHVRVDAAIGGSDAGTFAADLFKARFKAAAILDYATSDLALAINFVRDDDNDDLTGFVPDDGLVIVDLVGPGITDVAIANTTLTHTDDYIKNCDAARITAIVTDGDTLTETDITANLTGFGGDDDVNPDSYTANLATWTLPAVACAPADGDVTVTVSATDPIGNPSNNGSDLIIADNTAPTPLTGLTAEPAHMQVALCWDDAVGNDSHFAGVILRYDLWINYPAYPPADEPAYPATATAGVGTVHDGGGDIATHSFGDFDRGIYYYGGFVYDMARNFSIPEPGGGSADRSTNYHLADIAPGGYDGYVDVADITALGACYGTNTGDGTLYDSEVDVGPTDSHQGNGIPLTDDSIGFEDMMIFALNFGVVAPAPVPADGNAQPRFAWYSVDEMTWALALLEPCPNLKALHLRADLPSGIDLELLASSLLDRQTGPVFLQNAGGLDIGLAVMGSGLAIHGSGELFRLRLSAPALPGELLIETRDTANEPLGFALEHGEEPSLPAAYQLARSFPNPFNPKTTIRFDLPETQDVKLVVFDAAGRRVRVLVDEIRAPGFHTVEWNGRDEHGVRASSGLYFYRIKAGPLLQTERMVLLK